MVKPNPSKDSESSGPRESFLIAFGLYGAAGFQLAITVVAGLFFGRYLDQKLVTTPWLTLGGLILGCIGGFYNLIRILEWNRRRLDKE